MVSRPECMTSLKTCHFSSQLTRGVNNRGQFICVRYLPNAALMLVLKSCLMEIFLLLMLRFPGSVEMCLLSQPPSWQRRSWIYESLLMYCSVMQKNEVEMSKSVSFNIKPWTRTVIMAACNSNLGMEAYWRGAVQLLTMMKEHCTVPSSACFLN